MNISSIHLTNSQKRVLCKIAAAPNPSAAFGQITGDSNLMAARNQLMNMGAITLNSGEIEVTDIGQQIAKQENIYDEAGQLTQSGQQYAGTNTMDQPDANADAQDAGGGMDDMGGMGGGGMGGFGDLGAMGDMGGTEGGEDQFGPLGGEEEPNPDENAEAEQPPEDVKVGESYNYNRFSLLKELLG